MSGQDSPEKKKFWGSDSFANLLSLLALIISLFVLYRTELAKGKLEVAFPSRVAIASAKEIKIQSNDSDKILLSFSINNTGVNLKTIKDIILTITDNAGEEMEFVADAQFDQLKNIRLFEFPLEKNENYSLVTAFSIPPETHYVANHLFFYRCDQGWHSKEKQQLLECEGKPDTFQVEPGLEYKARIHVDAFEAISQDVCFTFVVPDEPQPKVLDFSPVYEEASCR